MGIVYIPNITMKRAPDGELVPTFDYTPAKKYGDIQVLVESGWPPAAQFAQHLIALMREALAEFSDDDYIVAAGEPATLATACMVAAEYNDGRIKMLRWDRHTYSYQELRFDLKGAMNVVA